MSQPDATITDDAPLRDQVAIVTGATSGIGLATAVKLVRLGASLVCVIRNTANTDNLDAALARVDGSYVPVVADLAAPDEVRSVVPQVMAGLGRLDILVNSGGIADTTGFLEQSLESFDHLLNVDLRAPFVLSQEAARVMISGKRQGRIVNLSSSTAFRAILAGPAYASAKGGLNALTRSAAGALGPYGITVNAVVPGLTATRMAQANFQDHAAMESAISSGPLQNLLRRVTEAEDIADMVAFLCTPAARQVTGQLIHVSAGAVV